MKVAVGIKRLGFVVVIGVVGAFVALAAVSFLIPADTASEAVKAEIRAVTGLEPTLRGDASVSLFPSGTVTFHNVSLGDQYTDAQALVADRLVARLRLLPLLIGHIEIADIALIRPIITVTVGYGGGSNWSSHIATLARVLKPKPNLVASFSELRIEDGTIIYRNRSRNLVEVLSNVDMALAWPAISKSFAATGRFVWRNEPIDASATLGDFRAALAGDKSGIKVRLSGAPMKLAFEGTLSHQPTLKLAGTLATDTDSFRNALRWLGEEPLPGGGFQRFALKAETNISGGTVSLSDVNVELDGNTAEGALTYGAGDRDTLQGTLAADDLDLTPYISTIRLLGSYDRDWSRMPLALYGLDDLDLDLRLSAARVKLGSANLGRSALVANLRDGNLTLTIGESQAFGGVVKGALSLAKSKSGVADTKAQLQLTDIDLEQCLGQAAGFRRLVGKGNIQLAVEASGASIYELTQSVAGTASLTSSNGAVTGLDVKEWLRQLESRPLSSAGSFRNGRTPYDKLAANVVVKKGEARIESLSMTGPSLRVAVVGQASIPTRALDLSGTAILLSSAADPSKPEVTQFELPFVVRGAWEDPIMLPDPQILIRRSAAAAPLLRDSKTRDAVRSVIERLTGTAQPETAPTQPLPVAQPQADQ